MYDLNPETTLEDVKKRDLEVRQYMESRPGQYYYIYIIIYDVLCFTEKFQDYLRFRPEADIQAFELST
jgi:hypothetical protein